MKKHLIAISSTFVLLCGFVQASSPGSALDGWQYAKWIGFTGDARPEQWSTRKITQNSPPQDISSWKPTAKDLRSQARKSFVSPLLRKEFSVDKAVESAVVQVCGLGLYELLLNGEKVNDHVLSPAQTSYDKRVFYQVLDVTRQIRSGRNAIGLMLGNGFYGQNVAFSPRFSYGTPRVKATLRIRYADGTESSLVSDESWRAGKGPILFDNIYLGETFDARLVQSGWATADFDDSDWSQVELQKAPGGRLVEQVMEPMRKVREIPPVAILPAEKGWIVDMGENMTGWLEISVEEAAGTVVKMRFAEHLMPDRKNIDTASTGIHATGGEQKDIYICRGGEKETWEPRFTYHGFRYVQITGLTHRPLPEDLTGWFIRTDVERIGTFECSDPRINTFYEVSMRTIEGNMQGLLSDCPHRERCAWMGDMHAVAEAASYNYDLRKFWPKMVRDIGTVLGVSRPHRGSTLPKDRRAPANIAIGKRTGGQARPDWGAATVLLPWYNYLHYGDLEVARESWPMMRGWMAFLDREAVKDGIIQEGYGDWCPPGGGEAMDTPVALTSTALYYQSLIAMSRMAMALDKPSEAGIYADRAGVVRQAFHDRFYTDKEIPGYGSQTGSAVALFSGLVPADQEQLVADGLASLIMDKMNGHYTTGIFGHRPLYTLLNDYGHSDITSHMWRMTSWPSLGFLTEKHGLTTWPEVSKNWDTSRRYHRHSYNHPMQGGFAATFHESIGGIRPDPEGPGFRKIILKPSFITGLEWAKVSLLSPQGLIGSDWKRDGDSVIWQISIPNNSTARVELSAFEKQHITVNGKPAKQNSFKLESGEWNVVLKERHDH